MSRPTMINVRMPSQFGLHLPKIRVEARKLILAQVVAGGEPAEATTARVVQE